MHERLTEPIPLSRGARQEDSLTPMLYILCVECLACKIRSCPEIEGFLLPPAKGLQDKVGVYADDTTSLVKFVHSLAALLNVVRIYERGSGAKLNVSKTTPRSKIARGSRRSIRKSLYVAVTTAASSC